MSRLLWLGLLTRRTVDALRSFRQDSLLEWCRGDPAKPSLELLRSLTDEHVLRALMEHRRLTRAELAARTGLSKPTVSRERAPARSEAGLLADTGERTTGRGRVGSYYGLADDVGCALAVSVAPEGVVAETHRRPRRRASHGNRSTSRGRPDRRRSAGTARRGPRQRSRTSHDEPRLAVVSAADPVDRATGRLVHLPDAPFLLGELDPVDVLAGSSTARSSSTTTSTGRHGPNATPSRRSLDDFAYLYLGEGLGCAVVSDGEVRRGHAGLAGEIAHVVTIGPDGRAVPFIEVFAALDLRQPASTAIDVRRTAGRRSNPMTRKHAICGQPWPGRSAASSPPWSPSADPELVVVGGHVGHRRPSSSTPSPRSSSDSPAMSRSGPRDSPTHPPSPAPGTTHSMSFKRPSPPPPDRHEPERARQWPAPGPPRHS